MAHNVRAFLREYYGDSLPTYAQDSDVTVGVAAIQLVPANARRILLAISNYGLSSVVIGRDYSVGLTTGVVSIDPGVTLLMDALNDLENITRQWIGIAGLAGNAVHILETILTGLPDPKA